MMLPRDLRGGVLVVVDLEILDGMNQGHYRFLREDPGI